MQNYVDFAVCTSQALDFTCRYYQVIITDEQKNELLASYRRLPAFDDVQGGLAFLKDANYQLYAFSNGRADAVKTVLANAGIRDFFHGVVSVDDLKSFKPNPAVYSHFLRKSGSSGCSAWLISSNPFDVIGAISAGMRAVWVQRTQEAIFDPWGMEPTITVGNFGELAERLSQYCPSCPSP